MELSAWELKDGGIIGVVQTEFQRGMEIKSGEKA